MMNNGFKKLGSPRWWLGMKPPCTKKGNPKLTVAVVIPAYNEQACIADTIKSVREQTVPIDEIIVVDDCSSDRTGKIAQSLGATVVCTLVNQGTKAMAQNYVLANLKQDLVATIDADTILEPDAIEKTLPYFNNEKTFSVCGLVVPQKIETIWERGRFIEYLFGIEIMKSGQNNVGMVMVSSGCFSVFRYSTLKELGFFNERTMAEDMDLTWAALIRGYRIYCEPDAICYPLDPATMTVYYKQLRRWFSGFLQNLQVHKIDLIKHFRFGLLFSYYLLEAVLYPIVIIASPFLQSKNWNIVAKLIVIHMLVVAIPSLYRGWKIRLFWKTLFSIPAYFLTRPVNVYTLYVSILNEWIIGRPLKTWDKGH